MRSAMKGVATAALVGAVIFVSGGVGATGDVRTAGPVQGVVLDVGSKHTVSYYVAEDSKCNLTLMVGEKADENGENSSLGARIRVTIDGGKAALVETAEGRSLEFTCASGAKSMSVRTLAVVAYRAPRS